MKTIIKKGDLNLLKEKLRFHCIYCKCIFDADKNDYVRKDSYQGAWIEVTCPFCGKLLQPDIKDVYPVSYVSPLGEI